MRPKARFSPQLTVVDFDLLPTKHQPLQINILSCQQKHHFSFHKTKPKIADMLYIWYTNRDMHSILQ